MYLYSLFHDSLKNGVGNGFNVLQLNNFWLCHIRYLGFFLSSSDKLAQFMDIIPFGEKNLKRKPLYFGNIEGFKCTVWTYTVVHLG